MALGDNRQCGVERCNSNEGQPFAGVLADCRPVYRPFLPAPRFRWWLIIATFPLQGCADGCLFPNANRPCPTLILLCMNDYVCNT
jgi:hypothetical protein